MHFPYVLLDQMIYAKTRLSADARRVVAAIMTMAFGPALLEAFDLLLGDVLAEGEAADAVAAGYGTEALPVTPPTEAEAEAEAEGKEGTDADGWVVLLPPGKLPFTQPKDAGKG